MSNKFGYLFRNVLSKVNYRSPKCNLTSSDKAKAATLSNGDDMKQNENNFRLSNEYSSKLEFSFPETFKKIPLYRIMDRDGNILSKKQEPNLDEKTLIKMYKTMMLLQKLDLIMYEAQRQGRISFYLTSHGESAIHIGTASGLDSNDLVFCQYREAGVLLYRGYDIKDCCHQIYGNSLGSDKGKQAPIHYGSKELNYVTISSTIATQLPQAVGAAYAFKRKQNNQVVATYFGDGASSTGDAHVAMNFAAVFDVPIIFICRNNGFAISTPVKDQYRGDGIASRGAGYGITTLRVDGNDLLGIYNATKEARRIALRQSRPVLIEAMTYRLGHHSTSDDSTAYRSIDEMNSWNTTNNPIDRFEKYLTKRGLWSKSQNEACDKECLDIVTKGLQLAENTRLASPLEMFKDVYDVPTKLIQRQMNELKKHLAMYENKYPMEKHEK